MKRTIQFLVVAWFVAASAFVLLGGILLVWSSARSTTESIPALPEPPACDIKCTDIKTAEELQKLYTARASAYEKYLAALKAKSDAQRSPFTDTYKVVAKETLQPLLTTILTALLGFVFAQGVGTLINNQLRIRAGKEPESFSLL